MSNSVEYSLDIGACLGAALQGAEIAVGIGDLLDLSENGTAVLCFVYVAGTVLLLDQVLLVPDKHYWHPFLQFSQQVILDLSHPEVNIVERLIRSDIVNYDHRLRVRVEAIGDGLEAFLTCTIIGMGNNDCLMFALAPTRLCL